MFNVFVFCGGKCGGSTITLTLLTNGYNVTHLHSFTIKGLIHSEINTNAVPKTIENSCKKYEEVFIIDSYRTPIERKISSFFQNIELDIPNYNYLTVEELIIIFNNKYFFLLENYHPINEVLEYYNIPLFDKFDFKKGYNIFKNDNKIFIKLLFKNINKWEEQLSEIFQKKIIIQNENLTINKNINNLYEEFKKKYKVPKNYLLNELINDSEFKIYNSEKEQKEYIELWMKKSY